MHSTAPALSPQAFWSYEHGNTLVDPTGYQLGDYYGRLLAW